MCFGLVTFSATTFGELKIFYVTYIICRPCLSLSFVQLLFFTHLTCIISTFNLLVIYQIVALIVVFCGVTMSNILRCGIYILYKYYAISMSSRIHTDNIADQYEAMTMYF